ncbi:MAG: KEOPS complex subunit Cgi121 [Thaumarchaeota archaeon]|nr:KEOPS complex subunit Cgi121 [Nitrososphaerota archaeon]
MPGAILGEVGLQKSDSPEAELARLRSENPEAIIQLARFARAPNVRAIEMIAAQTLRARETDALVAERPEVDLLLRLAGTSQISEAIGRAGYKAGGKLYLVAAGTEAAISRLRRSLRATGKGTVYAILPTEDLDESGREMVEAAALLGTRR